MNPRQLLAWIVALPLCIISIHPRVYSGLENSRTSFALGCDSREEYAIWTLAIENVIEDSRSPEMILVSAETGIPGSEYDLAPLLDSRPKLSNSRRTDEWIGLKAELLAETLSDFEEKNQTTELLLNNFRLPLRAVTITERELSQLHAQAANHFWETLREKYPHAIGVFRVSRIGFSSSRTQAIVFVQYQSGPEGGDGRYVLLRKENGTWICRAAAIAWMS